MIRQNSDVDENSNPHALWEQKQKRVLKTVYLCNDAFGKACRRKWDESLVHALHDRALKALLASDAIRKRLSRN